MQGLALVDSLIDTTFLSMEGWCSPDKAKRMARLVVETEGKTCVELGVFGGRSLAAMALAQHHVLGAGTVDGVDPYTAAAALEGTNGQANDEWWAKLDYETILAGAKSALDRLQLTSVARLIRARSQDVVANYADGSIDVLHVDSNHSMEVSCAEVEAWHAKVRPGGYWIADDTGWATMQHAMQLLQDKYGYTLVEDHSDAGSSWRVFRAPRHPHPRPALRSGVPQGPIAIPRAFCVTVRGEYVRMGGLYNDRPVATARSSQDTINHFVERGVDVQFFYGIHAPKLGIVTTLPYEVDNPGSGFNMGAKAVGCWLSHRALWAALLLLPDTEFFVIEDDAVFAPDWRERMSKALQAAPSDWDMIYVGSCCTEGKVKGSLGGGLYDVRYPMCTHGYLVRRKALLALIETQDEARCYGPIDISMTFHSHPKLKIYTILPRVLDQYGTTIST